jgi:uncharacterized protein involved in response to NO
VALFESGFRPFFLLAGLDAPANMILWLAVYFHPEVWPADAIPAAYWHAHEMLFGFAGAAIGGFMLTAVPNWTGRPPYRGAILYLITAIWLAGRIVMLPFLHVAAPIAAAIDLAFFPVLAIGVAPSLFRAGKYQNMPFLGLLSLLFAANLCFHLGMNGSPELGEHIGLYAAIDVILVMIVIIGGRIVPSFTRNALLKQGLPLPAQNSPWIEPSAIATILLMIVLDMAFPLSKISGGASLVAAVVQAIRISRWHGHRTLRDPLLWVLHLAYVWLTFALFLKAASLLLAMTFAEKWLHALTIGAFSTMIMAVMSRAALGHSGRPLVAPSLMSLAYLLVTLAAAVRVLGSPLFPAQYDVIIGLSGSLWIAAFAIYLWNYVPILVQPRVDGKPG